MNDSRSLSRKEMLLLGGMFLAALLIRLYFLRFYTVISADGVGYVRTARSIASGNGWSGVTFYGVVYPALVASASFLVGDTELAGRLVSIVMGSLMVIPLYLLGLEFFTKRAGLLACMLVLVWGSLRGWSCEVMTQATYITLLLTGIYVMWVAFRNNSPKLSFVAGLVMALSYLTRPEALITFVALSGALLLAALLRKNPWQRVAFLLAAGWAGFALPLIPFVFLIHNITGKWGLSGKTGYALADALSEYLGRPDMKNEPGFQGMGLLDVIRQYPDFLWANFRKNLVKTWETMLPYYVWGMCFLGFISYGWDRDRLSRQIYLVSTFSPLLVIIIFFFVGPEYLQPYLPILFLWGGAGLLWLEGIVVRRAGIDKWPQAVKLISAVPLSAVIVIVYVFSLLVVQLPANPNEPYNFNQDGGRFDQKRIGLMLKQVLPPNSHILTRWGRISFYAEMEQVMMPQAGIAELLDTAAKNKVKYIVIDGMLAGMRPQYEVLFAPLFSGPEKVYYVEKGAGYRPLPDLRLYFLYKDPSSLGVAVYEMVN
ncbi:MAG TPA: glycosyltransferase family 39 protein [Geobacteraceae bacterium]